MKPYDHASRVEGRAREAGEAGADAALVDAIELDAEEVPRLLVEQGALAIAEEDTEDAKLARALAAVELAAAHERRRVGGRHDSLHKDVRRALGGAHRAERVASLDTTSTTYTGYG